MKKLWSWLGKNWKTVLKVIGIGAGAAVAYEVTKHVAAAFAPKVSAPTTWQPDPADKTKILVKDPAKKNSWVSASLPEGMTSDKVSAAGLTAGGAVEVESAHTVTDRTVATGPDSGSSLNIK